MHLEEFIEALERGVAKGARLTEEPLLALGFRFDFGRDLLVWWFKGQGGDGVRREFSATFQAVARLLTEADVDRLLVDMFEDEVRRLREVLSRLNKEKGLERKEEESRGFGL